MNAIIVYDYGVSPPTYGDFLLVVMLARYCVTHDMEVAFYIVNSGYRDDWAPLDDDMKQTLLLEQLEIANMILKGQATITTVNWPKMSSIISKTDSSVFIPFKKEVSSRTPIYNMCFNTVNRLMETEPLEFRNRFLLSFDELYPISQFKVPSSPYITWHCRRSRLWAEELNTTDEEFLIIADKLKELFPSHAVMLVSDDWGCSYFRELAQGNNIDLLYSKDYSPSFLYDGILILGSDYYFQLRGGGVGVFVMFSNLPCDFYTPMVHETEWSSGKATSWASEKQTIQKIDYQDKRIYLPGEKQ